MVAQKVSERLKQQFIIDNRVGASGNMGTEAVARAEPDGYTIGLANTSTHAVTASVTSKLGYDPVKDFAPVSMLGSSPFVFAAYPGLAAKTVQELIALSSAPSPKTIKLRVDARPATLALPSPRARFVRGRMAKVEMVHVPYRGAGGAIEQSTSSAGAMDTQFGTIPAQSLHANIREGKLRALAVTGAKRNATLPEVPTIAEAGLPSHECGRRSVARLPWCAAATPAGRSSHGSMAR